jgi:tetratricopeptide (TPR) repeat protein
VSAFEQSLNGAIAAVQRGDWQSARQLGEVAARSAPNNAVAQHVWGLALIQSGEVLQGVSALEAAARLARHDHRIAGHLAQAYAMAGRHDDALQAYRRASRQEPTHWPHALGAAIALASLGKLAEAEVMLQRLSDRYPGEAALWYNLGCIQRDRQDIGAAEKSLRQALQLDPTDVDCRMTLGSVIHSAHRFADAIAIYRECLRAAPDAVPPRLNLISALMDDGRLDDAVAECRELIAFAPDVPEAHRFLGAALGQAGHLRDALAAYARGAELQPDDVLALRSHGGALAECGHLHAGLRTLAKAWRLTPAAERTGAEQLDSMIFLANGLFADGWQAYRTRPAYLRLAEKWSTLGIRQDLPENLAGQNVIVRREQGLGDELFFLRYLPMLKAQGARVTAAVSPKITELVSRSGTADRVVDESDPTATAGDVILLCGDLPGALSPFPRCDITTPGPLQGQRRRDFSFAQGVYYPLPPPTLKIPALPEKLIEVQQLLAAAGPGPYIGVTWRAGTAARDQLGADWVLNKSVPVPALGAALSELPGTLLALQRHPAEGEIAALSQAAGRVIADFTALNDDLEAMHALLTLIDDYVGVSNTNMHLRAATGRGASVLVPNPAEWRWMASGRRSPWFPAFRIYRQNLDGSWHTALDQLLRDLRESFPASSIHSKPDGKN